MRKNLICITAILFLCAFAFLLGRCTRAATEIPASVCVVVDSITTKETVANLAPALAIRDSVVVRYQYKTISLTPPPENDNLDSLITQQSPQNDIVVAERGDSVELSIPMIQKAYETEDYRAF